MKRGYRITLAIAVAIAATILGWSSSSLSAATVKVTGIIKLQYQFNHAGTLVEFEPANAPGAYTSVTTSSDGSFEAVVQSPAGYVIRAAHTGYSSPPQIGQAFFYKDTTLDVRELSKLPTQLNPGVVPTLHLSRAESPYQLLSGRLECGTLTVEAGCRVLFESAILAVTGVFQALGSESDSVYFNTEYAAGEFEFSGSEFTAQYLQANNVKFLAGAGARWARIDNSQIFRAMVADSSLHLAIEKSDLRMVSNPETQASSVLVGSIVDSHVSGIITMRADIANCFIGDSNFAISSLRLLTGSNAESSVFRSISMRVGGALSDCALQFGSFTWYQGDIAIERGTHIERCSATLEGTWLPTYEPIRWASISRSQLTIPLLVDTGTVVRDNTIGCIPGALQQSGTVEIRHGGRFENNRCFGTRVLVDANGVATGNIAINADVNYRVENYGVAVNNVSIGGANGFQIMPLASVHHNAAWGATDFNWVGPALYGVPSQLNANGDPCDALFNLTMDPHVQWSPVDCGVARADDESPLLGAGDAAFGSPHIGFPDSTSTGIVELGGPSLPAAFVLTQNYPNPFNATTDFRFSVPATSRVTLQILNVLGQVVATVYEGECSAGTYLASWDARNARGDAVSSGVYFYRLSAGEYVGTRKMLLLK